MSTTIKINGATLVPIKEAAAQISYTRDYVARLAREGKIVATQVGRQWFVDMTSLQNFSEASQAQEAARKLELRRERKRELFAKEEFLQLEERLQRRSSTHRASALAMTGSVVSLGLVLGVGFYTAWLYGVPQSLSTDVSTLLSNEVMRPVPTTEVAFNRTLPSAEELHETMQLTTVMEQPIFIDEAEAHSLGAVGGGVMLLPAQGVPSTTRDVAALFSDPVVVDFTGEQSGVVFFEGESGEVREYPFVTVPVTGSAMAKTNTP